MKKQLKKKHWHMILTDYASSEYSQDIVFVWIMLFLTA